MRPHMCNATSLYFRTYFTSFSGSAHWVSTCLSAKPNSLMNSMLAFMNGAGEVSNCGRRLRLIFRFRLRRRFNWFFVM